MFETALIRRHIEGEVSIDAGIVAETLLFYQNVHVLADRGVFTDLLRVIGSDNLLALLDSKALSLSLIRDFLGVQTQTNNDIALHRFVAGRLFADKNKKRIHDSDEVALLVEHVVGKGREAKKLTRALLDRIKVKNIENLIPADAQKDIYDPQFVRAAIKSILGILTPEFVFQDGWTFDIIEVGSDFLVGSNLNLSAINQIYHKRVSREHSAISHAFLLGYVLNAKRLTQN